MWENNTVYLYSILSNKDSAALLKSIYHLILTVRFRLDLLRGCYMKRLMMVVGMLFPLAAIAADGKAVTNCAAIVSSADRLVCYDKLASKSTSPKIASFGQWKVSKTTDPFDDKEFHRVELAALPAGGSLSIGQLVQRQRGQEPSLIVRCEKGKADFFINWLVQVGGESAPVTYRVDTKPAVTLSFISSTDGFASFFPGNPAQLLSEIADSRSFLAKVSPKGVAPTVLQFETEGAAAALNDLRSACG
jgi:type VI secretion system protein VasI